MKAVTTFSPKGYEQYGKKFLETFVKHWPCAIEVYYEEKPDFEDEKITYIPISSLRDRTKFIELAKQIPGSDGIIGDQYSFHHDSIKFCNKVFCQLACEDDIVYWVDADTVTYRDIPKELLESLVLRFPFCYFGRNSYTETGLIGFNKRHNMYKVFERQYRKCYLDRILFTLPGWHDCYAFEYAKIGIEGNNLSPNGQGLQHVIAESFMANYIDHLKGARKKRGHSPESIVRWW